MKAVFIDSKNRTVTDVEISGTLQSWYDTLGVEMVETAFHIDNHDSCMVDEEGLLKSPEEFFSFEGAPQPYAGNGLIVGVDDEGETVSCKVKADDIRHKIIFHGKQSALDSFIEKADMPQN